MQSGTWGIPGGKVDYSEDPKDSAIREVVEEIGGLPDVYFDNRKYVYETPLNTGDYISGDEEGPDENRYAKSGDVFRYTTYLYIVKDTNWVPELNWEHKRVEWFGIDELPSNTISILDEKGRRVKPLEIAIKELCYGK
jgi:8-oxo-dGTP pyrophosphatase MutT (NUDIX family)